MSLPSQSRRRVVGARLLAGLVSTSFLFDVALAQGPAVSGVYNRAASMQYGSAGSGSFGASGTSGYDSYGSASNATNAAFGANANASNAVGSVEWKPIVVSEPEYVHAKHDSTEPILSVATMAENYAVLTASGDKTAQIWTLEGAVDEQKADWFVKNGRVQKTYKDAHRQGLTDAILSPTESHVITAGYDGVGRLWTINNQENIRPYRGAKDRLWRIAISNDGQYVGAACNDGRVYFWESLTVNDAGKLPNREDAQKLGPGFEKVGHEGPVFDVAFSPDGGFCATAGADNTIRVWNLQMFRQVAVIEGHADKVYSVRFSADGNYLLSASRDKTARLWSPSTGAELCRFVGHLGAVREAQFTPDGGVLTASDDGTARLWLPQFGANEANSANANGRSDAYPSSSSYGSDGRQQENAVALPTRKAGKPKGVELATFEAGSPVFSAATTFDGVYVVGGCADGKARVWRVPGMSAAADLNFDYGYGAQQNANGAQGGYPSSQGVQGGYPASSSIR
ncbi:MAG: WD40 repeat domain-containing protein [Thermoguttaceae bacterium]|nr:WD40 repeat domain-containing protein [Thermoguttaceae bacterium]